MSTRRMSGEERRSQLLKVAREVFARRGYRATTADVAREAGVSEALVVKHFRSKEELFRAAVLEPLAWLVEWALRQELEVAQAADPRHPLEYLERQVTFGTTVGRLVREHGPILLTALREAPSFPEDSARLQARLRALIDEFVEMVGHFSGQEPFRRFPARASMYWAIGGLALAALMGEDPEESARGYFEMALFGLLTDEARRSAGR
ncbi:MAG TPA: helix-turn-helix domain-containing protein [Myxococcota bacterium]